MRAEGETEVSNGAADGSERITPAGDLGRRSAIGISITILSQVARFLIQFGSLIVVSRLLLPWQFGLVAMVGPLLSFLYVFADLGLAQAVVQRPQLTRQELSSIFFVIIGATFILSLIVAGLGPIMANFYHEPRVIMIFVAISPIMVISGLSIVQRALLTRDGRFGVLAVADISSAFLAAVSAISSAMAGLGYWALVVQSPVGIFVASLVCWIACPWRPSLEFNWRSVRPLMSAGGYVASANLGTIITATIDNILIGAYLGKGSLGLYDQGYRLVTQSVAQLLNPVARVMTPLLVRASREMEDYSETFLMVLRAQYLILWPGLMVAGALSLALIRFTIGAQWSQAAEIFSWFCVAAIASPLFMATSWLFLAENRLRAYSFTSLLGSALTALAVVVGLNHGVGVVARNVALSYAVIITPILCLTATRHGPVKLRGLLIATLPYVIAGVIVGGLLKVYMPLLVAHELVGFGGALATAYAIFLIATFANADGRRMIRMAWNIRRTFSKAVPI